jgi:hypothetical protein
MLTLSTMPLPTTGSRMSRAFMAAFANLNASEGFSDVRFRMRTMMAVLVSSLDRVKCCSWGFSFMTGIMVDVMMGLLVWVLSDGFDRCVEHG